ncbi:response regulator [Pelagicoccus sp. SDUM812002]|uniref:response regulator n=1 Tax=Pelagicoccus sp. SDUM812002 TaxID=3041266 RepID=UPI0028108322|nr:response regulator [Pelagicoccus sp. SDUM812002]MDQ8184780.1 response regulator [Pelagicoccus sp. SDUM812002]
MDATTRSQSGNLLLVDDDNSTRTLVGALLRRLGYCVEQAPSAKEARDCIETFGFSHFDLIISDYWMPGENGLEFLKYISLEDPTLSVILMTVDGERRILENLIQINGCGFIQKPINPRKLKQTAKDAVLKTKHLRGLRSTECEANKLGENQRILLQKQLNAEWADIEFFFISKSHASGDFVSVIPLQNERKALLVSDASGHELSSALQSNYFHGLARGMLKNEGSMETVFEYFNHILMNEWIREDLIGHSLSANSLIFDKENETLSFINAGAPHPMIAGLDGFASSVGLEDGFSPLGWFDQTFHSKNSSYKPGYICTWTDGLSDLAECVGIDPLALADRLLDKSRGSSSMMAKSTDDIAVVRVKTPSTPQGVEPMIPLISLDLSGDRIGDIDSIQEYCEKSIRIVAPQIDSELLSDILVCLREGLINALKHGCHASPELATSLRLSRSHDLSKISIQIRDEGSGHNFDWETHGENASENLIPEHRGLIMMQSIPSRIDVSNHGSSVLMEFECEPKLNLAI